VDPVEGRIRGGCYMGVNRYFVERNLQIFVDREEIDPSEVGE
jgi:hypothetical protein